MKLRLPHKLQTAILTAFASVTFFTVGTATLGAAQGEEAPEFASFTDTEFEVSEEELEVDLGEEEEEETKEPDSAPSNHAGFNGIYGSSDDADRQLANGDISESTSDTENVGTADQANYTGTSADLPSNDLGFTSNLYASGSDTSNGSVVDSPVTSFTQAPQIAPTGGDSAAGIGSGSTTSGSTSSETSTSPGVSIGSGLGAFGGGYYPAFAAAPSLTSAPAAAGPGAAASTNLGKFLFMGDSITHGVVDQTYRWQMFKGFVDNGISFDLNGPKSGYNSNPANMNDAGSAYGKVSFENVHYAQSSGRAYEMISGYRYGVSVSKVGETDYDTYTLMIGTNDILSDTGGGSGVSYNTYADKFDNLLGGTVSYTGTDKSLDAQWTWTKGSEMSGNLNTILNSLSLDEGDNFYVLSVPVWAQGHGNHNNASDHAAVAGYNTMLQQWVAEYNKTSPANVQYVDVNKGLTDVTVPDRGGVGPFDFFSNNDRLHPSQQGSIIIGGNLSRGMGLAGRTAGLHRADTTGWTAADSSITLASGASQEIVRNAFIEDQGYTIDFHATFGDGANNNWLDAGIHTGNMNAAAQNVLAITIGDGINSGTLNLAEGYIMWGSNILYCQDNSQSSNDAIRIAYHNGSTADNVAEGYYVWLGDMLIGQGLNSTPGQGWNGIKVSSTGGSATLTGLMYTNTAYAPTTGYAVGESPYYVTQDRGQTVLVPTREAASNHHADPIPSGVDYTSAPDLDGQSAITSSNVGSFTGGKAVVNMTHVGGWFAVSNATATLDIDAKFEGKTSVDNLFAVQGGTTTGNILVDVKSSTINNGTYGSNSAAVAGSYNGAVLTGCFSVYVDNSTINGDMVGGTLHGTGRVGSVNFVINSGTVNGNIYGGSKTAGTVGGNVAITINDGTVNGSIFGGGTAGTVSGNADITINGGIITGDINGGSIGGISSVTVASYKPLIKGNITADNVTLRGVEDTEYAGYMDTYRGTVTANSSIILENYTAKDVMAKLVTQDLTVSGTTKTTIHDLTLTSCSITAGEGTDLTLADSLTLGNAASFSGNIALADGLVIDMTAAGEHQGYSDGDNGYLNNVVVFKQADNAAAGSSIEADWSTIQGAGALQGATFSQDASGNVTAGGITTGSYHITTGTVYYGGPNAPEDIKTAHDLILEPTSSATLVMAANFEPDCVGGISVAAGAQGARLRINAFQEDGTTPIVILASNVHANAGLVLEGDGTYALSNLSGYTADNGYGLGANVSLDPAWKGTVLVSSSTSTTNANLINFSKLGNSLSTVELNGLTGWATSWAGGTIEQNIKLTNNDGAVAWKNSASNSSGNIPNTNFTGTWSGDGTFEVAPGSSNQRSNYTFSGDISAWTGKLLRSGAGTTVFTFAGDAREVNADIERTGGDVSLVVNTDTVFKKNVTDINNGLTVANGKHATFNGTTSISGASTIGGTIYNNGAMTLAGTGTVNLSGNERAFELYNGDGGNTYSNGDSGYLTSGSAYYYLIKGGENSTLSGSPTIANTTLEGNSLIVSGTADTGLYYVNRDLSYDSTEMDAATGFVIKKDTTLSAVNNSALGGSAKQLHGEGTYALYSGQTTLNGNLSIGSDWTGTVRVSGSISNLNISTLGDNIASTIEFAGMAGSFCDPSTNTITLTRDVVFTNAGEGGATPAIKITQGYSRNGGFLFSGNVSGSGTFLLAGGITQHYTFSGDVSQWDGMLQVTNAGSGNGGSWVKFTGNAHEVNASIDRTNGTFGVIAETDVTFNKNITATGFTNAANTVTLGDGITLTVHAMSAGQTQNLGNIVVEKSATIVDNNYNATMNFTTITGGKGGTLTLLSSHSASTSEWNLGVDGQTQATPFGGKLVLMSERDGNYNRAANFNFVDGTMFSGAEVQIKNGTDVTNNTLTNTLKLKAANVTIGGLSDAAAGMVTDKRKWSVANDTGQGSATLTLNGSDTYTSDIKLESGVNLAMSGTGTQTFKGDLSAMAGGTVKVSNGTLTLNNSSANKGSLASVTVTGGTLNLDNMNVAGATEVTGGMLNLTSSVQTSELTVATGTTLKLAGENKLTVDGLLTLQTGATLDLANIFASPVQQPVMLAAPKSGGLLGAVEPAAGATYVLATADDITLNDGVLLDNIVDGYRGTLSTQDATGGSGKELILTLAELSKNLIWDNNAQDNKWDVATTQNWHKDGDPEGSSTFAQNDNVIFASGTWAPALQTDITAGTMTLEKDAVVKVNMNGRTLTAELAGEGTYDLEGKSLGSVSLGSDWTGAVRLKDQTMNSTKVDYAAEWMNALAIENSWLELENFTGGDKSWASSASGYPDLTANIRLTSDGEHAAWTMDACATTLYTMNATGKWEGEGEFRMTGGSKQGVKFTGDISGWEGKLTNAGSGQRDVTFAGSAGTVKAAIDNTSTGTLNVIVGDGNNSFDATFTNTVNASSLNVTNKATATLENTATLGSLSGAGTLVVDGTGNTVTINGSGGHTGAITVSSGTLVAGTQNALGTGAITVDGGTLDLRTANTMGALTLTSGTLKLAGEDNLTTGALTFGNGFTLDLANIHPTAGTDTITLATTSGITGDLNAVTLNNLSAPTGYEGVLTDNNNSLVLTFTPIDNSLVWDNNGNTGKWNTTDANWHVGKAAPGTSTFSDNADVKFTKATNGQMVTLAAATTAGNITIDEGANIIIKNDGKALAGTLKGSGTYALESGVSALPGSLNVKDEGWTGTVKLTGVGIENIDLNSYGHAGSKVEFDGVSGHFLKDNSTPFKPTLVLSGGGLTVDNAYSGTEYIFAGGVEGAGNINATYANGGSNNKFTFTGSVKDWTGAATVATNKGVTLAFAGAADTVNATIGQASGGGTINLEVGNGADTFSTTFNKAVNASKMEVKQSASATINETSSLGNLVGPGNVIVDNESTLTVGSATGGYVNVTVKDGATLAINGKDGTDYKMRYTLAGGTLTNTGNNTGGGSIQNDQITLTKDSTISGTGNFYMLAGSYNKTELHLDTHTLEKTGTNEITMYSTEVSGGGTLKITNGSLNITRHTSDKPMSLVNANIVLNKGGAESLKGDFNLAANNSISSTVSDARMTANVAMQGATTLGAEENCSLTASGVLSGSSPITKTGDGTVVLTGNNSYTGGTTVSGGKLVAGSANALGNGDVLVNNGGALELTSSLTSISGNLTVNGGTLTFAGPENLTTTGEFTFGSGATLDLTNIHPGSFTDSITLATATGGISGNVGAVTLTNLVAPEGYKGILSTVGNDLVLTFTEQRDLVWQGGSGDWNTDASNHSWYLSTDSSQKVAFQDGDSVSFLVPGNSPVSVTENIDAGDVFVDADVNVSLSNGSTTGEVELDAGAIDVKGDLTVTDVTVQAQSMQIEEGASVTAAVTDAGGPASLDADISGAGDMAKTGAGTLNLTGDNAGYTGTVTISGGTVNAAGTGTALGNTPNVVMAGNGVELSGSIAPTGDINITSTASGTVSANIDMAEGATLTFNTINQVNEEGEPVTTTVTANGTITGTGDGGIFKDGKGTLVLNNAANTFTGGVDIKGGTVLVTDSGALGASGSRNVNVENGSSLAFATGDSANYTVNTVSVSSGSSLVFSGTNQLHIDTLNITAASAMDLTNISLDNYGSYVLATVDSFVPAEVGIWKPGKNLVEFVSMIGIHGSALTPDSLVSLYYEGGQLVLKLNTPNDGFYWKPSEETGVTTWNTQDDNWSSTPDLSNKARFVNEQTTATTGERARSAYFMNEGEEHIVMGINGTTYVRDMIVANGKYYFTAPEGTETSISLSTTDLSNFVVRSGAEAHFDGVSVGTGEKDVIHICSEATATMENVSNWGVYSINNEGTFSVDSNCFGIGESILGHVDNTGDFSAYYRTEDGILLIGEMANREGAKMVLSGHWLAANEQYGNGFIANDGELTFDATGFENGQMYNYIPVTGIGTLETKGEDRIVFSSEESSIFFTASSATVEQTAMTLGAAENIFGEAVQIADSTTVLSGSEATFYGGGSLGDLALTAGGSDNLTKATLGGYNHKGTDIHDSTYNVGAVTAGENTVLTVENGAVATVGSYNAGDTPAGTIVVGAPTSQTSGTYSAASLTVNGLTNVETLDVQNGTANLNGYATVGTLTQSGGTLNLNAGGYVENATVSGGTLHIGNGKVLTLGSVITETGDYTVAATTGSINADALTLEMSKDNVKYTEIGYTETPTAAQSGFLSSGEQYVKVFDIQSGTLTGHDVTVTHKDAAGPMTLISSGDFAGYGYLDSSETVYTTYYVRDNYVTGAADDRTDVHGKHTADEVKLSNITSAATDGGETLAAVVFDQTAYNSGVKNTNYHGTLTVDENTKADLFHVTENTRAAINIASNAVVLADQDYAGVEGTLELAGSGVYQIDNRGDLGENVSLLADTTDGITPWAGTVRLTGTAEDLDMAPLSVGEGTTASTIEFNQWTGTFAATEKPMKSDAKILLTGTGTVDAPAITFAATESDAPTRLLWTNTVTGENAGMIHQTPGDVEITMTGDTSGWGGTFYQDSAGSTVTLNFLPIGEGDTQNATMLVEAGTLNVTYGGDLKDVNGAALLTGADADLNLAYTGTNMQVNSDISQYHGQGKLSITVGDDEGTEASASFNGAFSNTQGVTMTVKENAAATFNTNAPLLRVVGEEGSNVAVNSGKTLSLASTDPVNDYSQFYNVDNQGTISMMASGGDIKLVDTTTEGKTYNLGALALTGTPGTAAIETSGVNGQTTNVNITALSGTTNVLKLTNDNATGTVNYNLGGAGSSAAFSGKIAYGVNGGNGAAADLVIKGDDVAANAVLETAFAASGDTAAANIVVDTAHAKVLGLSSDANSAANKTMVVSGTEGSANKVIEITGNDEYTYAGKLGGNLDVTYSGTGTQTIQGGVDGFRGAVKVESAAEGSGTLAIQNLMNGASVNITDLTIGASDTLDLNDGSNVGTASVSGSVVAKGGPTTAGTGSASKLDGNLTLGSGATYDVSAAAGTGGLNLTGALTIAPGAKLSDNDLAGVLGLGWFGKYDLAFGVTDMSSFGDVDWTQGVDASTVFGNDAFDGRKEEFYIRYSTATGTGGNGNNVGAVYIYRIPEPTTGTLSLLALAALAARRRRKG